MTGSEDFNEWYASFQDEARSQGYNSTFDEELQDWAYDEWQENHREPDDAANIFVNEIKALTPEKFTEPDSD